MPQMSPMNWLIISLIFFFLIYTISSFLNKKQASLNQKTANIKILKWKW